MPDVTFFQQSAVQKSLERILYTWLEFVCFFLFVLFFLIFFCYYNFRAIRHPASGYVQGINDLATPFLVVFLSEHLEGSIDNWSISDLDPEKISDIEADCYWCLSKLLDGMQDHYTFAQPGIQRLVFKLKELVRRIDGIALSSSLRWIIINPTWFICSPCYINSLIKLLVCLLIMKCFLPQL